MNPYEQKQEERRERLEARATMRHRSYTELHPIPAERAEALQRAAGDLLDRLSRYLTPETCAAETRGVRDALVNLRVPTEAEPTTAQARAAELADEGDGYPRHVTDDGFGGGADV